MLNPVKSTSKKEVLWDEDHSRTAHDENSNAIQSSHSLRVMSDHAEIVKEEDFFDTISFDKTLEEEDLIDAISLSEIAKEEDLNDTQKFKRSSVAIFVRKSLKGMESALFSDYRMTVPEMIEFGSDSLSDEEPSMSLRSISQSWTETDPKFIANLGGVPSVDNFEFMEEWGHFTNPLDNDSLLNSTESSYKFSQEQEEEYGAERELEEEEEDEGEEEDISREFSFEDFDSRYPKDIIVEASSEEERTYFDNLHRSFVEFKVIPISVLKDDLVETEIEIVKNFLDELITEVLRLCEESQKRHDFAENLNKNALFKAIFHAMIELHEERKVWVFLNRKGVEFFRRKGMQRFCSSDISEDSGDAQSKKYKETIEHLDQILGAEFQIEKNTDKVHEIAMIADEEEEKARDEIIEFEKMVKTVLKCEPDTKLTGVVNDCLHSMAVLRDEISKVRVILIQRQHTITTLRKEIDELDDLGQGLTLLKYENLEVETRALGKKIEDRKTMLARQHDRFHTSLHTMAHINFSRGILNMKLRNQTSILSQLDSEKDEMRKYVHYLNLFHERRRKEINDLILKSGLLAKPALLTDYDVTIKNIEEKRKSVEQLRQTKMDIEAKLKKSEKTSKPYRTR